MSLSLHFIVDFPHFDFPTSVRNLGLRLDQELAFCEHLNRVGHACFYHLRQLQVISHSLSPNAAPALVHAFVSSKTDYCSTIYMDLPLGHVEHIEHVLHAAAMLVHGISKFDHVSHYMCDIAAYFSAY